MNDDFSEYERMKGEGVDAKSAVTFAEKAGLDPFAQIRMLRGVYGLSLKGAKEVTVTADDSSTSLSEHQSKLLPSLEKAIDSLSDEVEDR